MNIKMMLEAEVNKYNESGIEVLVFDEERRIFKTKAVEDAHIAFIADGNEESVTFYLYEKDEVVSEIRDIGAWHDHGTETRFVKGYNGTIVPLMR